MSNTRKTTGKTTSKSSSTGRTNATERMRAARAQAERSDRIRRRVVVGAASAAVLALAAGVAFAVGGSTGSGSGSDATANGPLVVPANATGPNGTVISYGKADAPHTLEIYEDFRCPYCEQLETSTGRTIQQLADAGTYKIEYHLATFLDKNLGGKGSRTALAAAGAALNEGVDKFKQFHDVLYANQPDEREDGFGNVNRILDLAGQVPGLKTDAFVKAVQDGTYTPWAAKVNEEFNNSDVTGTPTVKLDGKKLDVLTGGKAATPEQFTAMVKQVTG